MNREGWRWTAAERECLRAEWADPTLRRADVAARRGRSQKAVAHEAHKLGLGRKASKRAAAPPARNVISDAHRAELARRGIRWEAR